MMRWSTVTNSWTTVPIPWSTSVKRLKSSSSRTKFLRLLNSQLSFSNPSSTTQSSCSGEGNYSSITPTWRRESSIWGRQLIWTQTTSSSRRHGKICRRWKSVRRMELMPLLWDSLQNHSSFSLTAWSLTHITSHITRLFCSTEPVSTISLLRYKKLSLILTKLLSWMKTTLRLTTREVTCTCKKRTMKKQLETLKEPGL